MTAPKKDILQGWKDIAAYVSRDVRTVKRWEKQRGLPVRRMPGEGRANVYALIPELDNWLSIGGSAETNAQTQSQPTGPDSSLAQPVTVQPVSEVLPARPGFSRYRMTPRRRWIFATAAIICLGAVAALAVGITGRFRQQDTADLPPFNPTQTAQVIKHSSKVSGVDALYLRGIYFYEQRTPETLERALKCFKEAIAKDPGYAPAYAGLAQVYNLVREYSMMPDAEAYPKAQAAAERAIALDPNLSEAHASLGFVKFFWDGDAVNAENEFKTSIALDPHSALAHHWYGSMLTHQARFAESLAQLDLAQRLQPTSTSILSDKAFALGLSGHRNEASDMLQELLNEDPQSPPPHYILALLSLVEPRDIPRYLNEMRRFADLRHDSDRLRMLDVLEPAYRSGGAKAMWSALLAEEEHHHPSRNDRTKLMADAEALLGRSEDSLRDLAQQAARRDPSMIGIAIDPLLDSVRHDPRFAAIVKSVVTPITH